MFCSRFCGRRRLHTHCQCSPTPHGSNGCASKSFHPTRTFPCPASGITTGRSWTVVSSLASSSAAAAVSTTCLTARPHQSFWMKTMRQERSSNCSHNPPPTKLATTPKRDGSTRTSCLTTDQPPSHTSRKRWTGHQVAFEVTSSSRKTASKSFWGPWLQQLCRPPCQSSYLPHSQQQTT